MASNQQTFILPAPPRPPQQYSYDYGNQLNRWFESLTELVAGIHYLRGNGLFLPGLPRTGYGLKPDEVFNNGGILTVVSEDDIWIGSLSVTALVGTVTVTV